MTYAIRQSDTNVTTLTFHALSRSLLSPLSRLLLLFLLPDPKPRRDGDQVASMDANTRPAASSSAHLTAVYSERAELGHDLQG